MTHDVDYEEWKWKARFRTELKEIEQLVADASDALSFDPPCVRAVEQRCHMVLLRIKRKLEEMEEK